MNSFGRVLTGGFLTQSRPVTIRTRSMFRLLPLVLLHYACTMCDVYVKTSCGRMGRKLATSGDMGAHGEPASPPPHAPPPPLPQFLEDESGECRSWILGAGGHMEECKVGFPGRGRAPAAPPQSSLPLPPPPPTHSSSLPSSPFYAPLMPLPFPSRLLCCNCMEMLH